MSSETWDVFQRYQKKGLDARRAGQWDSARIYLLEAARSMVELSRQTDRPELHEARREMARRLLELARDCEQALNHVMAEGVAGAMPRPSANPPAGMPSSGSFVKSLTCDSTTWPALMM